MEKLRRYPVPLNALRLTRTDVQVWSRLTGMNDSRAAQDLISMQFQGREIQEEMTRSLRKVKISKGRYRHYSQWQRTETRRQAATNVFQTYLK